METLDILTSTLRFASPLLLAAMGGLISERSGVVNIALEGLILIGAFSAAAFASLTGNPWLAFALGGASAALAASLFAGLTVGLKADQVVAGTAVNMLAWGTIPFVGKLLFDSTANTPPLDLAQRLPGSVPIVSAVAFCGLLYFVLGYTRAGLWLTFAGEKPQALATVGVKTWWVRTTAVVLAGMFAGLGGAELSLALSSSYTRNMAAGRGFMALAALILGKWRPLQTAASCMLFGFCEVLQLRLQGVRVAGFGEIPIQLVQIAPYVLTLILLAGFIGESRAPAALGKS